MYSAVTKDDISRSGKSSLQDFLNSTKRTETTIAKAPGQIVQKKSGGEMSGAAVTNNQKQSLCLLNLAQKTNIKNPYLDQS
jgi:hypothetical protein